MQTSSSSSRPIPPWIVPQSLHQIFSPPYKLVPPPSLDRNFTPPSLLPHPHPLSRPTPVGTSSIILRPKWLRSEDPKSSDCNSPSPLYHPGPPHFTTPGPLPACGVRA
ncbi:hypothetical protein M8J76_005816 [Diaphorina citri]|nr:hypothetical protein M8J76_005816 [Diaphorina citri]